MDKFQFGASLLLLLLSLTGSSFTLECHKRGGCFNDNMIDFTTTGSEGDCLDFCQKTQNCTWYTFREEDSICGAFGECTTLGESDCVSCLSGQVNCANEFICNHEGRVEGSFINFFNKINDSRKCLQKCKAEPDCEWYSYHDEMCTLLSSKTRMDDTCLTCQSGQKECRFESSQCADGWTQFKNESCLQIHTTEKEFSDASVVCQSSHNGFLADVKSQEKQDFIDALMVELNMNSAYLGGRGGQGNWRWRDDSRFTYTNWYSNPEWYDDCMQTSTILSSIAGWSGINCFHEQNFICQYNIKEI